MIFYLMEHCHSLFILIMDFFLMLPALHHSWISYETYIQVTLKTTVQARSLKFSNDNPVQFWELTEQYVTWGPVFKAIESLVNNDWRFFSENIWIKYLLSSQTKKRNKDYFDWSTIHL